MLELKSIRKTYENRVIFDDVNLSFNGKGIIAILGDSGCGKSTLLNMIAGIDKNYEGSIQILGQNLKLKSDKEIADFRLRHIGYVYQNFGLLNLEDSYSNISLPLYSSSNVSKTIGNQKVLDLMRKTKTSSLKRKNVNKLSGGEKQRIAICRALINSPEILLCDEPTGALDEQNSPQIFNILQQFSTICLVIVVTHDRENAFKFCDKIYEINDSKITLIKNDKIDNKDHIITASSGIKTKKTTVPFFYKIKYGFHKLKSKKYRTAFSTTILSLALTGIGISFLLSNSMSKNLQKSLNDLVDGQQIVMTLKNENSNTLNAIYSAPENKVKSIEKKYANFIDGTGVSYLVNFEDFFKDENSFYIASTDYRIDIPYFSARNVNEFTWINDRENALCYPYTPEDLGDDEIILGLTYSDMVNFCYQLQIQRNFASLGNYIKEKGLSISLEVENSDWQYYDEQLFNVSAVIETKQPTLYHYNLLWNKFVFEDSMRFPVDDDGETFFPWEMYRLYYFLCGEKSETFLNASLLDSEMYDFVLERDSDSYSSLQCKNEDLCNTGKLFIFYVDKNGIDTSLTKSILNSFNDIRGYYFSSSFGYSTFGSGIISGFSKNVFLSFDEKLNDIAIDADTSLNGNEMDIELPQGIIKGNYLNSYSGGLTYTNDFSNLIEGRIPKHNGEIAISNTLANTLNINENGLGKYIYLSAVRNETLDNQNKINKEYKTVKLVVTGIIDSKKNCVAHNNLWPVSFFRDKIGVSNFNLVPNKIVFTLAETANVELIINKISKIYTKYQFSSPTVDISNSISQTFDYMSIVIRIFSILTMLISIILLSCIIILNVEENKNEIKILYQLGIPKRETKSLFVYEIILQSIMSIFISIFELLIISIVLSKFLSIEIGLNISLSLSPLVICLVLIFGILVPIFFANIVLKIIFAKNTI